MDFRHAAAAAALSLACATAAPPPVATAPPPRDYAGEAYAARTARSRISTR